jgi:hypothetical protein
VLKHSKTNFLSCVWWHAVPQSIDKLSGPPDALIKDVQVVRILTNDLNGLPDEVKGLGHCTPVSTRVLEKVAGVRNADSIRAVAEVSLPTTVSSCESQMFATSSSPLTPMPQRSS